MKCGFGAEYKYGCPEHVKIEVEDDRFGKWDSDFREL